MSATADEKRVAACVALIGRTGAQGFQIRYSDDEEPTVWMALAHYRIGENGRPVASGGEEAWQCAAALDPLGAVFALCEKVIDGGLCKHCSKPTGITLGFEPMPLRDQVCWWQYDPELSTFRRSCE